VVLLLGERLTDSRFRWVSCQLDVLASCIDPKSVREALSSLPPTLNETYSRILTGLPKSNLRGAKRLLQFLTYSERPLWINEAVDVLAVDSSQTPKFDVRNRMPNPVEITKLCGNLVVAVEGEKHRDCEECTTVLQLAHFSVKEYLLSNEAWSQLEGELQEPIARATIAETCLAYLLALDTKYSLADLCSLYPLADFAARSWTGHAARHGKRLQNVHKLAMELFANRHLYRICWLLDMPDQPRRRRNEIYREPSTLYYASFTGLESCVEELAREDSMIDAQTGLHSTALQAASAEGHLEIVQLLLHHEADVNIQSEYYGTALQAASAGGHLEIVQLLLNHKADVDIQSGRYGTALQAASAEGHLETVQLLLNHGADVDIQSGYYGTALCAASAEGHLEIVQLLLNHKADVNIQSEYYGTALQAASAKGHLEIVQLLLNHRADVDIRSGVYGTALLAASAGGHLEIVQLLLNHGADVNIQSEYHGTALQAASARGHLEIVRLLQRVNGEEEEEEEDDHGRGESLARGNKLIAMLIDQLY